MSKKTGTSCVVRGCASKTMDKISLFRFPKDPERANIWFMACNREDLSVKTSVQPYDAYRLCALHFDDKMYANDLKNRLLPTAVPTIFPHLEGASTKRKAAPAEATPLKKVCILTDILVRPPNSPPQLDEYQMEENQMEEHQAGCSFSGNLTSDVTPHTTPHTHWDSSPLSSPVSTQTPVSLTSHTPRKEKLREKVKSLKKRRLQIRGALNFEENKLTLADLDKCCDEFLPEALATFVKMQARLCSKKPKGRRYTTQYKQFALALYFLGPRAYNFLKKLILLPSKRSLERMTEKFIYSPGLANDGLYRALKIKIESMLEQDKHCIICIDEMSLKANLFYHTGRDEIVGFKDLGNDKKEFIPAQNACVIMARGLYSNWKQPIAYYFLNYSFPANELCLVLEECIEKLSNLGLSIDAVVSDMGSNFIQLTNILKVTPENPEFIVGEKCILYLFDTPHLLKATRNNLLSSNFHFNGQETSWSYIEKCYVRDKMQVNRCAPKLTDSHISPNNFQKMKVKFAVQVLSNTVASGLNTYVSLGALPSSAMTTTNLINSLIY